MRCRVVRIRFGRCQGDMAAAGKMQSMALLFRRSTEPSRGTHLCWPRCWCLECTPQQNQGEHRPTLNMDISIILGSSTRHVQRSTQVHIFNANVHLACGPT